MATYREIKAYVKAKHGFMPQDCWIAHAKASTKFFGGEIDYQKDIGTNTKPCSEEKRIALLNSMRELGGI